MPPQPQLPRPKKSDRDRNIVSSLAVPTCPTKAGMSNTIRKELCRRLKTFPYFRQERKEADQSGLHCQCDQHGPHVEKGIVSRQSTTSAYQSFLLSVDYVLPLQLNENVGQLALDPSKTTTVKRRRSGRNRTFISSEKQKVQAPTDNFEKRASNADFNGRIPSCQIT